MSSEAALLHARGIELKLGQQTYWVRYGFDAMEQIEKEFDGLADFIDGLATWKRRFQTTRRAMELGLAFVPGDGPRLSSEQVGVVLNEHQAQLLDMLKAIAAALTEAMGVEVTLEGPGPKVEGDEESPGQSPGGASTGTPLSVMDGQTPSSGE